MKNKQHIKDIPSGMCRSVEWNDCASSSASRQGCILSRMQERGFCAFSTGRCIDFAELLWFLFIRLEKIKFSCTFASLLWYSIL